VATSQRTPVYSISIKEGVVGLGGERAGSGGDGRGHEAAKVLGPGQYRVSGSGHRALEWKRNQRRGKKGGNGAEGVEKGVPKGMWAEGGGQGGGGEGCPQKGT
jgi:hypothetical protein